MHEVFVIVTDRSGVPEDQPVFVKVDFLFVAMELVLKVLTCLVDPVS